MKPQAKRNIAWGIVAIVAIELAWREIARRSLLRVLLGTVPPVWGLAGVAIAAGAAGILIARNRRCAGLLLTTMFAAGIALQLDLGARLQSDGFYYFAYLRSLAFDGDVNFMNDYRMLGLGDKPYLFQPTRTGHAESAWTIGPAIVWWPFFAVGHVAARSLHASGVDIATDGTSYPYRQAVCVASLFYGLLGCWFAYRFTRVFQPGRLATPAVILTIGGSFMLWYFVKEPSMTHAASMASVAGFLWMWASTGLGPGAVPRQRTLQQWAILGLIVGFAALIRWQNVLFAMLPGFDAARLLVAHARAHEKKELRDVILGSLAFLACAVIAFVPQMLAWQAIYGQPIARSPVGPQVRWTDPHLVDILWSARNGLFSTSPILYLGAIGLAIFAFARPAAGVPAILAVAVMVYFNASIQDWWGSAGFGGRRFDGLIPLFSVGLAVFLDRAALVARRHPVGFVTAALSLVVFWNLALMGAAQQGVVRIVETLAFDRAWGVQARVFHSWFGNPFTYPASLVFALRNGVSPGEYDLLSTNRFLADPLQPYGRVDVGSEDPSMTLRASDEWLLGEGWLAPERDGAVTFRWADSPATLRIPLDHPAPLRVQVRARAFAFPDSPQQTLTISTSRGACSTIAITGNWQTLECTLPREAWRAGVNTLTLAFAYSRRPADVGVGGDLRSLAAAIDFVRVSVP